MLTPWGGEHALSVGLGFHTRTIGESDASIDPRHAHRRALWHNFVAIELSQRSWVVTLHSPDKDKISRHKLEGGDHAELLALVDRVRERRLGHWEQFRQW